MQTTASVRAGGSSNRSSALLAARASVVPGVVRGRKGGFCPRDTSFRVCLGSVPPSASALLSTRVNSILDGPWHHHLPKEKCVAGEL